MSIRFKPTKPRLIWQYSERPIAGWINVYSNLRFDGVFYGVVQTSRIHSIAAARLELRLEPDTRLLYRIHVKPKEQRL